MSFCSPLWLIASALPALKARTAKVAADNAISRVLPLLQGNDCIFFLLVRIERNSRHVKDKRRDCLSYSCRNVSNLARLSRSWRRCGWLAYRDFAAPSDRGERQGRMDEAV